MCELTVCEAQIMHELVWVDCLFRIGEREEERKREGMEIEEGNTYLLVIG